MSETLQWQKDSFTVSTDKSLLQIVRIHHFLSTQSYWCQGIPKNVVEKAVQGSLCFGLYDGDHPEHLQIGYARVITDSATFAWVCDVYIEPSYRGRGLSKWMMECLTSHPDLQSLRKIMLGTKDAHRLYEKFGFKATTTPERWMEIRRDDIYQKMKTP